MGRYSQGYHSPPRRGYGGRERSPPRREYSPPRRGYSPPRRGYGGYGRRKEPNHGSLLVRNIPLDCRPEELRVPFERFGVVRDVYIPKDYYTGEPRGFAFVQFVDSYDASEAQYHMNGQIFAGREISVVVAAESRKRPEDMRRKSRQRSGPRYGGRRSPNYRRSRSRSRSRSPLRRSGSGGGPHSRSYSASPRRRDDHSASPKRRPVDHSQSPRDSPRGGDEHRSHSPNHGYRFAAANGKSKYVGDEGRGGGDSPRRLSRSRSPSGSRSRSSDRSPARSR